MKIDPDALRVGMYVQMSQSKKTSDRSYCHPHVIIGLNLPCIAVEQLRSDGPGYFYRGSLNVEDYDIYQLDLSYVEAYAPWIAEKRKKEMAEGKAG